jgi:hypothetical protein
MFRPRVVLLVFSFRLCFAHGAATCKRGGSGGGDAEKHGSRVVKSSPTSREFYFSAFWPQLRRNETKNIVSEPGSRSHLRIRVFDLPDHAPPREKT